MKSMNKQFLLALLLTTLLLPTALAQEIHLELASLFADDMVLQQQTDAAIWGNAAPNSDVLITASWTKNNYQTHAGPKGKWRTTINTPKAGGPFTINVTSGSETITLNNVLSGEVWLCSGQSNMQWRMRGFGLELWKDDVDKANYPNIRYCQITQTLALDKQDRVETEWSICSPETAYSYSAIAFFFGRELHQKLDVPIGLINVNWGGSSAQAWMSNELLSQAFPEFNQMMQTYPKIIQETGGLYGSGKKAPKGINMQTPATLYNGMLHPLMPFAFRGVIWYQGEANVGNPVQYRTLFPAMIQQWRNEWGIGDFPFYYVQIAPYNYGKNSQSAFLREAQMMALSVPNTGMAVTMDVGEADNIHPKEKKPVAHRLALLALANTYGKTDLVDSGPIYRRHKVKGDKIRLSFDHVGSGLTTTDGKKITHFTIAGEDQDFVEAQALIEGKRIFVHSDKVANPVAVRFGWGNTDITNLANKEGLPASSFRTDDWEISK